MKTAKLQKDCNVNSNMHKKLADLEDDIEENNKEISFIPPQFPTINYGRDHDIL